jgi:tripartite-type tricarboxylate transporter receptor subunit TctC
LLAAPWRRTDAAACRSISGGKVRFIVPHTSTGGYDAYARLLQPFLERALGTSVVVENRSGAGGLVGAAAIRDAEPDGRALGILNASGMLAARLDQRAPDPATDFTILARLLSNRTVVVTGARSGIGHVDQLLAMSAQRPIVVGVRDAGSASMFVVPVVASLIGLRYQLVTGYDGNAARALAAIRGEVDLLVQNFDSVQRFIADGELRPLLQVVGRDVAAHPGPNEAMLARVPMLGGDAGVARRRAASTGRTPAQALQQATALESLLDAGRLIAAPPHLPDDIRSCLERAIGSILADTGFRDAATRAALSLDPADAATATRDVRAAAAAIQQFAPLVRAAMQQART